LLKQEQNRINQFIRSKEMRVIDAEGENLGVLSIKDALEAAKAKEIPIDSEKVFYPFKLLLEVKIFGFD
jgi:translation initiation factor IF-3